MRPTVVSFLRSFAVTTVWRYSKYGHSANEARPVHPARRTSYRLLASSARASRRRRQFSAFRRDGATRRARTVRHAVLGGQSHRLDGIGIGDRARALFQLDGALHAAVGAVRLYQKHWPGLHREHELRAALRGGAEVRDA